jgi:hypothetical protein
VIVDVRVGKRVWVAVTVRVGVRVREGVKVRVGVRLGVGVGVWEGVRVIVGVRVAEGVRVEVTVTGVEGVGVVAPRNTKRTASTPTKRFETAAVSSCVRFVSSMYSSPAPVNLYLPIYSHPSVT